MDKKKQKVKNKYGLKLATIWARKQTLARNMENEQNKDWTEQQKFERQNRYQMIKDICQK
tara:strand:+ start:258 stop:437 length:180 start_codon:yes stop_codon:yes gene_type:complete